MVPDISDRRAHEILSRAGQARILVLGDVMLDQFVWGNVARISPEAPVPIVEVLREGLMPGGAGNVARNLASLKVSTELFGAVGADLAGEQLKELLGQQQIGFDGMVTFTGRSTTVKTRVVAHQQQVVRIDRETRGELDEASCARLMA